MRILMISDVYFPRINGVSTSIQTFRRGLHAAGHETILIAPEYPGAAPDTEPDILRVPSRGVPRDPEDRAMKLGAIRALRPQLEKLEPDLVHIQTPFIAHYQGTALARALRVPVIETYHTYFEEYLHHYVPLLPRAVMRFIARRFTVSQCNVLDALVVPSRAMEQALLDYGVQCPMHIIPTGMEMDRFASGDGQRFRAQLGIAPGQPVLVHVGRIAHEKNIEFLFRMFEIVVRSKPGAVFVVAGEGPALTSCKAYVRTLGLAQQVRFVGYLSRERELLDCYRAGDLFVFSSKTETQGLVLLESLALGVPVVSTAHMGTADIVNPQRGAHVAPDDEAEFANIVVRLLDDAPRRAAMSAEARAYAATWSATAMADRLAGLYSAVLGQVSRNSPVSQPV
ncbi:MAG TPA: glycosyltransferase [Steroidobacteraceae bacterium]|jgi:glycosyltransferase involved in cell wall biosynthesis|nr:glycosyltransferase [Steroidobacteraceae bacterium]